MSILDQSANPMPMPIFNQCHQSVEPISLTNPYGQVCQSINHLSMQHQSSPIDCHSVRTNRKEMMELVLYGSCWSQRGTIINLPHFSSYQPTATRTPIQPLKYQSYVNQVPIIHQSEEDNCPSNKGTSVLHEATEVSRRRTIQTMNFWVSLPNSPTHGQYKTNLPIHHQFANASQIQQSHSNLWTVW